jgi:hypothetical protein
MMLKASGPRSAACGGPSPATASQFASWASLPTGGAASASALSLGGPESPGTPSATSGDLPGTHSAMCCEETSLRSSLELPSGVGAPEPGGFVEALTSALGGHSGHALAPPPLAGNPTVAPAAWPQLHTGCVWGTPAGGPVPPPAPAGPVPAPPAWAAPAPPPSLSPAHSSPEPLVLKQCGTAAVLPVAATSDDVVIPEGFFSDTSLLGKSGEHSTAQHSTAARSHARMRSSRGKRAAGKPAAGEASCRTGGCKGPAAATQRRVVEPSPPILPSAPSACPAASGPLGLQLKKSPSLLNLINSALGSSGNNLSGLAAMVC